jgi:photosystem II stability/assembly factor-like uncharacterized protein
MRSSLLLLLAMTGCDTRWSVPLPDLDRVPLSIYAPSRDDVFTVGGALGSGGDALFLRLQNGTPAQIPTNTKSTLWWLHGFSTSDIFAVGEQGTIMRFDGSALTAEASGTTKTLYGVWGASPADVWAVGGLPGRDNVLLRRQGGAWTVQPSPTPAGAYFKIWGTAADDIFICGEGGVILHFDGATWTKQETNLPQSVTLFTVHGRSRTDAVAVGGFGKAVALRYDGTRWSSLPDAIVQTSSGLAGAAMSPDGEVLLVGSAGTKLRGQPGALVEETAELPREDLHAAALIEGTAFAAGGNYLAPPGAARRGVLARR